MTTFTVASNEFIGGGKELSEYQLLASWAVQDLDHIAQFYAALAGSHDAEVGPWKACLGILLRRDAP